MELFSNNATTTLNGSILSGATSLVVTSASLFPVSGNFHLIIDAEIFLATAVNSNTFTVSPGQEGTSQAGHSNGATVTAVLTKAAMANFRADSETFGAYAGLPSPSFAGRVYEATDGLARSLDTGSAFLTFGPVWPLTPFAQAGFSYVNQGSATVTTANGISVLSDQGGEGASDSIRLFVETIPTAPYTLTVCFIPLMSYLTSGGSCGLVLRDSSSSKLIFFLCTSGFNVQVLQFTNPTTFSASAVNATFNGGLGGAVWLRIKDDNTNRKYSVSADGFNFVQILSETRTTFITANQIGIAMNNRSSSGGVSLMSVLSYLPTQP